MDIESKYKNESPLQLPSKLNSLDTGGKKQHRKLTWVQEKTSFSFMWYFFHYRIRYDIFSEGNISTLDNVPQGCGCKCYWKFYWILFLCFLLDYRIIINMEFWSFGERCISLIISVFQIVLRGKQKNPLSRGIKHFAGGIFYWVIGIWQGVTLNIWTLFKVKNKIL